MILKLEKIGLASQERSRASSFMNTKEAYDSQGLANTYNNLNDFFGPPSKHKYQMLDQTYQVPLRATKGLRPPAQPASK